MPVPAQPIDIRQALDGTVTQIDHILPYSRTLDDSPTNKVLCFALSNQEKRIERPMKHGGLTRQMGCNNG